MRRSLLVLLMLMTRGTWAQELPSGRAYAERELIERALARPSYRAVAESDVERERGRAMTVGAYPNPQVLYSREKTYDSLGTGEDYLSAAQVIDLGGKRRMTRRGGEARVRAREFLEQDQHVRVAAEVRTRFYEVLFRQARAQALARWSTEIERALEVVARRAARGDAAAYDQLRLARERTLALARAETERVLASASKQRLAAIAALDSPDFELVGTLLPDATTAELVVWQSRLRQRPDLLAREQTARAAILEAKAAGRMIIPDVRLEAGYKGVRFNPGRRTDGFLAGASLYVPLFDHGQGARRSAEAEARGQSAQRELAMVELLGEVASARETAAQMQAAAIHFRAESAKMSADLMRIATAGYEGGEMGIFELLDAYRGAVDDELTALDMELTARRANVELDRLTGGGVP